MKTTEIRRTRRADNPFDAKIEVRLYSTEKAKLLSEAAHRGLSASDLVRSQLGRLIDAKPPEPPSRPEKPGPSPDLPVPSGGRERASCDLVEAIADRNGISLGMALLKIRLGKVTVDGVHWGLTEVDPAKLDVVRVDGLLLGQTTDE